MLGPAGERFLLGKEPSTQAVGSAQNNNKHVILSLLAKDLAVGRPGGKLLLMQAGERFFAPLRMTISLRMTTNTSS